MTKLTAVLRNIATQAQLKVAAYKGSRLFCKQSAALDGLTKTPKVHLKAAAECSHPCHRCPHNKLPLCPIEDLQDACAICIATEDEIDALIKAYNGRCSNC